MTERMIEDGVERVFWHNGTSEFEELATKLKQNFEHVRPENWRAVSSPSYNKLYEDFICSVAFLARPGYVNNLAEEPVIVARKFFMNKRWVYDKLYFWIRDSECTLPRPLNSNALGIGKLQNVYGQPGDADFSEYQCLYFTCPDHSAVEEWVGEPLPQGQYSTHYAATFKGGTRVRVKTYCYDSEDSPFEAWEVFWLQWANAKGLEH